MFRVLAHAVHAASLLFITLLLTARNDTHDNSDNPQPVFEADVRMTTYGVPHVKANDFASLGFGVTRRLAV